MIEDITAIGDIPTNQALINSYPIFNIWQDYVIPDPIINANTFMFKYVYFKNGFPLSALSENPPSGDLLLGKFSSESPKFLDPVSRICKSNCKLRIWNNVY